MAIQNRRGLKKDFDPTKMLPGEWAVTIDPETENQMVYMCFAPGVVKRMGTYEDFKEQLDEAAVDREQIQANKTDITNLEKLAITPSASGTQIVAKDSAEWPVQALTVYGRTEQDKTTGVQLFDASEYVDSLNSGITVQYLANEDCFLLNGTATATDVGTKLYFNCPVTKGDTFTVSAFFLSGSVEFSGDSYAVAYFGASDEEGKSTNWRDVVLKNSNNSMSKACDYNYITSFWFYFYKGVVFNNYKVRIQLQKGEIALPYEPYTGGKPSPSPDYPQEIVSAGADGGIEVRVGGKNLFNITGREVREMGGGNPKTEVRNNLNGRGIYIGSSPDNYYWPGAINSYDIGIDSITVNSKSSGYGIGFDFVVRPGQQYTFGFSSSVVSTSFYTEQGKYISYKYVTTQRTITVPDTAYFMVVTFTTSSDHINTNITINNIQMELGTTATSYEPYRPIQTATIASANGLPGIPVSSGGNYTDESGQQWVCDIIEYKDGQAVYVKRVWTKTFDGSEIWYDYSSRNYEGFIAHNALPEVMNRREGFCNLLAIDRSVAAVEGIWIGVQNNVIYAHNSSFYDATLSDKGVANWKAYLADHPMTIMTYLATATETPLTDTEAAQLSALHTDKPTTTITNDAGVGMDMTYIADTKAYIDNKFVELQTALATTNAQLI